MISERPGDLRETHGFPSPSRKGFGFVAETGVFILDKTLDLFYK